MEPLDPSQLAFGIEVMFGVFPSNSEMSWKGAQQLYDLCQVVVIFSKVLPNAWLE